MSSNLQDQELLRQYLRDGSETAFRELVDRHVDLVYGAAFRHLGNWAPAEEVTQTVFIALARRAAFLTGHPSLAGWLYHTAINQARQQSRGEQRRRLREDAAAQSATTMHPDESHALTHLLDEALLELRADDREALVLRYFEDRGLREVGQALGLREDAAQKRVARALDALTAKFRRRGFAAPVIAVTAAMRAASHAAPAGLAALVTKAAMPIAASSGGAALLFGKFMALTKTQTAIVCALLATAPVAYEWHAAANAREQHETLRRTVGSLNAQVAEAQQLLGQNQGRLNDMEAALDRTRANIGRQHAAALAARSIAATNYYLWSDASDYVRLPKPIINSLTLVTVAKKSPLDLSGTEPLMQALGVTPIEAAGAFGAFQGLEQDYRQLLQEHAYLTNQPPPNFQIGTNDSLTLVTTPFGEASNVLRDRLRSALDSALGNERAEAVWHQAEPLFEEQFNDFGTRHRTETVSVNQNGMIMYWNSSSLPGEQSSQSYLNMGLGTNVSDAPEPFRPFVTAQLRKLADLRAAKLP